MIVLFAMDSDQVGILVPAMPNASKSVCVATATSDLLEGTPFIVVQESDIQDSQLNKGDFDFSTPDGFGTRVAK